MNIDHETLPPVLAGTLTGAQLRQRRRRLGFTQRALAVRLGIPANTLARWERSELTIRNPVLVDLALQTLEQNAKPSDE